MKFVFPILLFIASIVARAGFGIFWETLSYFAIIAEYRHAIDLALNTLVTLSGVYLADTIFVSAVSHAFASVLRKNPLAQKLLPIVKLAVRVVVWAIGAFLVISGLGYNITNLLAGTGFVGLGAALAGKETLSNLIGSLSLVFGKYFEIGDTIRVKKDFEGEVVEINLSRTKLIDKEWTIIYLPNKFLTSEAIENKSESNKASKKSKA